MGTTEPNATMEIPARQESCSDPGECHRANCRSLSWKCEIEGVLRAEVQSLRLQKLYGGFHEPGYGCKRWIPALWGVSAVKTFQKISRIGYIAEYQNIGYFFNALLARNYTETVE